MEEKWRVIANIIELVAELVFAAVFIGLEIIKLDRYGNISDYFIGSGELYDGARSADGLRKAALILSVVAFFLTAIALIVAALLALSKTVRILTVALIVAPIINCVFQSICVTMNSVATGRLPIYGFNSMILSFHNSSSLHDFTVANGSIVINTADVDIMWNKLQAEMHCCGITGYNDYNVDIWNTNPRMWHGRNPNILAPLTCCVVNDGSDAYPPTVNDLSPSCLYSGTVPSDYYQPGCFTQLFSVFMAERTLLLVAAGVQFAIPVIGLICKVFITSL